MNEVIQYNENTAITTTPAVILDQPGQEYNVIRIKNEDALDINLFFTDGETSNGAGNKYVVKAGDDLLHAFKCSGRVLASTDSGSTTANIFVQLTKA